MGWRECYDQLLERLGSFSVRRTMQSLVNPRIGIIAAVIFYRAGAGLFKRWVVADFKISY